MKTVLLTGFDPFGGDAFASSPGLPPLNLLLFWDSTFCLDMRTLWLRERRYA
jgi:hypothetical protein